MNSRTGAIKRSNPSIWGYDQHGSAQPAWGSNNPAPLGWYVFFVQLLKENMKHTRNQDTRQSKQGITNKPRPEIRDDLDSREGEEQMSKGNSTTHNEKQTKAKHLKKK